MTRRPAAGLPEDKERPRLFDHVPWIVQWSGEPWIPGEVIALKNGIGYADELPFDRGRHGELLRRGVRPVPAEQRGRPLFAAINHAKARRCQRLLLCQTCAKPAGRTDAGTLWVLTTKAYNDALKVDFAQAPTCLPCAVISVRLCPMLRDGYVALRAQEARPVGVVGILLAPNPNPFNPREIRIVEESYATYYDDPSLPWVLVEETRLGLEHITLVDLEAEQAAAA